MSIGSKEFGALVTFSKLDGCSFWLAQYLLIRCQCLLFDFDASFRLDKHFLFAANLVFKLRHASFQLLLSAHGSRKLELRARLKEEEILE